MLKKNRIGFFCNNSIKKLIESLLILINDPVKLSEFSENAYSYVKKHHDLQKIGQNWFRFFDFITTKNED